MGEEGVTSLAVASADAIIQSGAMGGIVILLLGYTVWNQIQSYKERAKMREENSKSTDELLQTLRDTNKIDSELARSIEELSGEIRSLKEFLLRSK